MGIGCKNFDLKTITQCELNCDHGTYLQNFVISNLL
jgi:hypothetical protein